MPSISPGRQRHSCGLAASNAGTARDVVVAGGWSNDYLSYFKSSVEIFSLDTETWRQGNICKVYTRSRLYGRIEIVLFIG